MQRLTRLLATIAKDGETQPPASEARIEKLIANAEKHLGAVVPADYLALLRHQDGVDYNGLVLYGSWQSEKKPGAAGFWQGIVDANTVWRDNPDNAKLLVLGDNDMDMLVVNLDGTKPRSIDKISGDVTKRYTSINAMLEAQLKARL